MHFSEFERIAQVVWDDIPGEYKAGVDGLILERAAMPSNANDDVFTLGECVTEQYPSQYGGPDTIRSAVVLYYGSFHALAAENAGFDWLAEIHETIVHELKHHLESLASEDALVDFDYAVEQNFKRQNGEPFDAFFFRAGELLEANLYQIDDDIFFEVLTLDSAPIDTELMWLDEEWRVHLPRVQADVTFFTVENLDVEGEFVVVRVLKRGIIATLKAAFTRRTSTSEMRVHAERA